MQVTLYKKLDLGETLYHLAQYHEAETLVLEATKGLSVLFGLKSRIEITLGHWYLAKIWLKLGKHDQSKELALKTIDQVQDSLGAQHKRYTKMREDLRQLWGINPDGTPFEGSVELGTDDSPNECETDNLSEGAVETPGQGNAEQR